MHQFLRHIAIAVLLSAASVVASLPASLSGLAKIDSNLRFVTNTSADYSSVRQTYINSNSTVPLAIVRPYNANQVAEVVKYAVEHGIAFTVRGGGHDLFGRAVVEGALLIDMREINYTIVGGNGTARIGGGITSGAYATALSAHGLVSPFASVVSLGIGWNTIGGYNLFSSQWGLAIDNVVGATIVNWKGEIVNVSANDKTLFGIRGAQGNFGVIVDLTIKVYPLEKLVAGSIFFNSSNIKSTIKQYFERYQKLEPQLPAELTVEPFVLGNAGPYLGRVFGVFYVWSGSNSSDSEKYMNKILRLGAPILNTISTLTPAEYVEAQESVIHYGVYGPSRTVSVQSVSVDVAQIIADYVDIIPSDGATIFYAHRLRGPSAVPHPSSCFGTREQHWMLELEGTVLNKADLAKSSQWAAAFHAALLQSDQLLTQTYPALTKPGDNTYANMYGSNWGPILRLKKEMDPHNVFSNAVSGPLHAAYH